MPRFTYRAKDQTLKFVEGTIEADSETAAIAHLSREGVYPITIAEALPGQIPPVGASRRQRVPTHALATMSRQLADLLSGGLPLFNALTLLVQQTESRVLREAVAHLGQAVRDGQALSEAMASHPAVFSSFYVSMVRAGEAGGGLDAVLTRVAELLESDVELKNRALAAMVYPLIVLVIGVITTIVLLAYVVPKLTVLFVESGQLLPLPTRMLLAISDALSQYWWAWAMGVLAIGWSLRAMRASAAGQARLDRVVLRLPLFGTLVRKLNTARLMRNLGVMVGQGVPLLQALEVAGSTISNTLLRQAVLHVKELVQGGQSLTHALTTSGHFPLFVGHMVAVGEESGTLEQALLKIASSYERETDRAFRVLTSLLEPCLIVAVGLVVMFIVISVLLPIFQIGLVAQ